MDSTAFTLILVSAVLHAAWNLILRKHTGQIGILWIGLFIPGTVVSAVSIANGWLTVESEGLEYLLASGIIHAIYFYLLSVCYSKGEISLVYPVSRGCAVGSACLMAWFLIDENISQAGYFGIAMVLVGVFVVKGFSTKDTPLSLVSLSALAGFFSGLYSIVDKFGCALINPLAYIGGFFLVAALCIAPVVFRRNSIQEVKETLVPGIQVGLGIMCCYLLVLYAYSFGQLSYIVPTREISVLFGAFLGWKLLGEKLDQSRIIGIILIISGIGLIRFV